MFDIVLKKANHIREYHIYRMEIKVIFNKPQLFDYFENLNEPRLFIQSLYQQVETHNPKGEATYCDLAYVIRGWITKYMIQYVDNFHINDNDLNYIFKPSSKIKEVSVSFVISTQRLRHLAIKCPEFYTKIRPTQLNEAST